MSVLGQPVAGPADDDTLVLERASIEPPPSASAHSGGGGSGPPPASDLLRTTGERIERLLEGGVAGAPVARSDAEELVRIVVELYGAGLERVLDHAHAVGALDGPLLDRLADDDLVSGLLLVHGLHPLGVVDRVERALEGVRPYLASHGGDVELLEVTDTGLVRLRLLGTCDGCPSSSVTLSLAVRTAVEQAAPETTGIDVADAPKAAADGAFIPIESVAVRARSTDPSAGWEPVPELAALPSGAVRSLRLAGVEVVVCRVGTAVYAFHDRCPGCGSGFAGAAVERRLGAAPGAGVLTCPTCHSHFDLARAGRSVDGADAHLDPLPLLTRDGVIEIAVPSGQAAR